jgi:DNA primase
MLPFFFDGALRNFQMRRDNPKISRSYYKTGSLLYNSSILNHTKKAYIVEGVVDNLAMEQNGINTVSTNCGLIGFKQEWVRFFKDVDDVILFGDYDEAGVNEAIRVAKVIGIDKVRIYIHKKIEQKGYDPVDFFRDGGTKEDLETLVNKYAKFAYQFPQFKRSKSKW